MQRIIQVDNALRALISRLQRKSRSARFRITTVDANRVVIETGSENSQSALTRAASSKRWTTSPATIISVKHTLWNVRKKPAFLCRATRYRAEGKAGPTNITYILQILEQCQEVGWRSAQDNFNFDAPRLWDLVGQSGRRIPPLLRPRKDDSISRFFVPLY